LQSVEGKAEILARAFRLFANAGVFGYAGIYWSFELKTFRVYATDPSRAVLLRYRHKKIVITPHDPQHFIVRARTFLKTADFPA
jgi:hypothetical protein